MEAEHPSYWGHSAHPSLISVAVAPLAGVLLSLMALWIAASPQPTHAVAIHTPAACPLAVSRAPRVHTVVLGLDGAVSWDGQPVAGAPALEARLKAVGGTARDEQAELRIELHEAATYGAVVAVMAAAQRHGVLSVSVRGTSSSFQSEGRCVALA
jgi:biopolymer transport protein ExbD